MAPRVVLDTNCLVSALIFSKGRIAELRQIWQTEGIIPVVCRETVTELIRVLSYPDRMIEPDSSEGLSIHASVGYAQRNTQAQSHNHGGQAYEKATVCGNGRP